jgi:glycosyltransferase 2 family protein
MTADSGVGAPRPYARYALIVLQVVLAVVVLWFAGMALRRQWTGVGPELSRLHPSWLWVGTSGVIFLATYAVLVETWREMLRAWRSVLTFWTAARIWSISNLGRYVPGKVWQIGAMGVMAQRAGVSPIAATGSAVLNTVVNLVAGFVIAAALGWQLLDSQSGGQRGAVLFISASVVLLAALPRVLPWLLQILARATRRDLGLGPLPAKVIAIAAAGNLTAWLLYGIAFAAFARGILGVTRGALTAYIAVYALSYLVGYLVLLIPAGLGVREASMVTLLTIARLADPGQAALLAVTSRLWLTVLEIVPGALFLAFDGLRRRPSTMNVDNE